MTEYIVILGSYNAAAKRKRRDGFIVLRLFSFGQVEQNGRSAFSRRIGTNRFHE